MTATASNPPPAAAPAATPESPAPAASAAADDAFWDAEPGTEIPRPPLFVVVIAEPGLGKTHIGCTFPGPIVVLDSEFRADEVLRKFVNIEKYWKKVEKFDDVRQAIGRAMKKHRTPGTILFDSGSDLQLMAEAEVLEGIAADNKKAHKTLHWGPVNKLFKNLFGFMRDKRWNAVFTARLKDEWKGEDRTGGRTPGGFVTDKLIYHADFALRLEKRGDTRVGVVLKNGAKKIGTYATEMPDADLTFAGIVREMEADAEKVIVTVSEGGLKPRPSAPPVVEPARVPPVPPTNTTPPAPAPSAAAVVSDRSAPGTPAGPAVAPSVAASGSREDRSQDNSPHLAGSAPEAASTSGRVVPATRDTSTDSPPAAVLGEPFLNRIGFRKTGRPTEEIGLDRASTLGNEWALARDQKRAADMVRLESELGRAGWFREPMSTGLPGTATVPHAAACVCGACPNRTEAENAAQAKRNKQEKAAHEARMAKIEADKAAAAQKAAAAAAAPIPPAASSPAPSAAPTGQVMATAAEVAELLALSADLGADAGHFWKKAIANKWTSVVGGEIPAAHAKIARELLVKAKAARAGTSAGKAA